MKVMHTAFTLGVFCGLFAIAQPAIAKNVKITPLGSHDGEFCQFDRAMILEDPDGTRFLYDPGRPVAGSEDPRLGNIDAVLLTHMHGDHIEDQHVAGPNSGTCAKPQFTVKAAPNTNAVNIVLPKKAKIVTGSDMPRFLATKLAVINIGNTFTTGPTEAAFVINELVRPTSVIPSHTNEMATQNGKVVPGTRTDEFISAVNVPAHLPLSGRTMEFDHNGNCAAGC